MCIRDSLRVCKILTTLGIDKFKITGGEPLVRKGCSNFIRELKKTDGVNKVTLTTNGILLSKDLVKLAEAGVDGINISLDFMDQEKYKKITGFDGYKQVISVINKAVNIGLNIKINVVLTEWTTMEDIQKFIDYMKAVSYTHLDVYKRQILHHLSLRQCLFLMHIQKKILRKHVNLQERLYAVWISRN